MATNNFKPFATSPDANVMTDEQLASAEELSTGFKLKSKADSKLIGKLIQDTSAAAYAIGEFVINNGGANDVTGTNPTQLAQDFDKAVKSVVSGSTDIFVTESDLTEKLEPINTALGQKADASALESKADKTELTSLAPLANPQFTGNVTINGTNVATVDDLAEIEVDLSNYTGDVSLTQGDNAIKMTSTGVSIKSAGFNGGAETAFDKVALKSEIPTDVLTKTEASGTYLTQSLANTTYATKTELTNKADASNVYSKQDADLKFATKSEIPTDVLTKTEAGSTYLTQTAASSTYATQTTVTEGLAGKANTVHTHTIENVTGLQDALDGKQATGDYAVKSDLDDYLPIAGGTITGDLTVTGTINASIEGTTENAVKLATARNITLTGAVTGTSTAGFDGSADVTINTTAVNGTMVTGVVPEAMKATQDGDGNVISTTYAKISQLSSVMTYKGTVASESALPKSDQTIGDVYNVTDTNMNYAWDGSKWDQLGSSVDLSGYLTSETANSTFATKSELTGGYLPLAGGTLTGNVTVPAPTAEGHASTKKYVDDKITGLNISQYATTASLTKYAPLANPKFTGTATVGGQTIATVNQIPDISNLATKSEVAGKANATHTHTVSQVTDLSTTLAKYLPLSGGTLTGKVTGTITQADAATNATNDGSGKNIASTYATKTELSDGLATKAASTHTHTTAQVDGLDTALAGKAATNHTHTIANVTDLQTTLDGKAAASHTHEIANVNGLQDALDGKQAAGDYALNSALEEYVPKAGDIDAVTYNQKNYTVSGSSYTITKDTPDVLYLELTGDFTFTCTGAVDTNRTIKVQIHKASTVSGTATVTWNGVTEWLTDGNSAPVFGQVASTEHNLVVAICLSNTVVLGNTLYNSENPVTGGTVTIDGVSGLQDALNAKINLAGARGQLAGYETVSSVTDITINGSSADSVEASGNVTVSDGTSGQCWTKVVHITAGTPNVQLGGAWHWQNGSNPEMKTGGFLVLCWCSTAGLAIYNNVG